MDSKWDDPDSQEYWNRLLKEEGLGVITDKQYVTKGKKPLTGKEQLVKNYEAAKRRNKKKLHE